MEWEYEGRREGKKNQMSKQNDKIRMLIIDESR